MTISLDVRLATPPFELAVKATIDGDACAILGPSGAGKTSLLESIAGIREGARGSVAIDGVEIGSMPAHQRAIGYVPQSAALFPHLDVRANVSFAARDAKDVDDAIAILALEKLLDRATATLSGGERQRVALARAIVSKPRALLLDEPLASVDVAHRERILPWLLRIRARWKIPLLYVTHDLGEASIVAKLGLLLRGGRVVGDGPVPIERAARSLLDVDPSASLDNVVHGALTPIDASTSRLSLGDGAVVVPHTDADEEATYVVAAEEILLSVAPLAGVSAQNVLEATIARVDRSIDHAVVTAEALGVAWRTKLTLRAMDTLGLAPEKKVWIVIKAHAFRRVR